jgi:hypothetical protein
MNVNDYRSAAQAFLTSGVLESLARLSLIGESPMDGCGARIGGPAGAEELGSVGERLPSDLECPHCPSS